MSLRAYCYPHDRYTQGCDDCRRYAREYKRQRQRGLILGSWDTLVRGAELERVRLALAALLAHPGVTVPKIAIAMGATNAAVYRMAKGETTHLRPDFATAILALTPAEVVRRNPPAMVDSTGAARRLQAMAVDQWSVQVLSPLCGLTVNSLTHHRYQRYPTISRRIHDAIAGVYEKIQGLADPLGPSIPTAIQARRMGYLGPERWDDETIDDPNAQPLPVAPDAPDPMELELWVQDALRLRAPRAGVCWPREVKRRFGWLAQQGGWTLADIGAVLGLSTSGVEYLLNGRKDRPHTRQR